MKWKLAILPAVLVWCCLAFCSNTRGETTSETVFKLYYVNEYYNPFAMGEYIMDANRDQIALNLIMSSGRFRTAVNELRKMDKAAAAQLVRTNLLSALASYSHMYDEYLRQMAPNFRLTTDKTNYGMIAFQVTAKDGEETIIGEKMKVFTLVWISGMLKLADNQELVEQVAGLALKQKRELNDPALESRFQASMLHSASLYNRQILGSGLIGVTCREAGVESEVMEAVGIQWQQQTLAAYEAPDYATGEVTVNFLSPMNDTSFDRLLREIQFK
jgi:hypothetical protein